MASSSSNNKIMHMLTSSDGFSFEVEEAVARKCQFVSFMIDDDCADKIPIANVTGNVLSEVLKYCKIHVEEDGAFKKNVEEKEEAKKKLQDWDTGFMEEHNDMGFVFQLILAANYLNVRGLLDLTCKTVADRIKDKQPDEIRTIFNIEKDYTPEEEAEILKENEWAFH